VILVLNHHTKKIFSAKDVQISALLTPALDEDE